MPTNSNGQHPGTHPADEQGCCALEGPGLSVGDAQQEQQGAPFTRSAYRSVLSVCSTLTLEGEMLAIMTVRA